MLLRLLFSREQASLHIWLMGKRKSRKHYAGSLRPERGGRMLTALLVSTSFTTTILVMTAMMVRRIDKS